MNKWLPILGRSAVSIAILGLAVAGFILMGEPEVPKKPPAENLPPIVESTPAIAHTDGISFDVDGVVTPFKQIEIASQVAGKVIFKAEACRVGRTVKKGDLLLQIEKTDYELEVRRLGEELAQADAMILELDAELKTAENQIETATKQLEIDARQLKRSEELFRGRAASESEVDVAKRAELTTRTSRQALIDQKNLLTQRRIRMEAAKSLVQANLDKADLNLKRTEIRSPIDAIIVTENVEQDGYVQTGNAMVVLQDTSRLDVSCKLKMQQMNWLWQGRDEEDLPNDTSEGYEFPTTPATVIYSLGEQDYAWSGEVDRFDGASIDNQTRMVPCLVHVDDPTAISKLEDFSRSDSQADSAALNGQSDQQEGPESLAQSIVADGLPRDPRNPPTLMSGMFVKVRIHADPPIPLVRLPQQAIQPGNKVWTISNGKLERKHVAIANSLPDHVIAYQRSGGLKAGDQVVISPLATPVEGMAVRTAAEAAASEKSARGPGGKWGPKS